MKYLFVICLLSAASRLISQQMPVDPQTGKITYTEVVKADSVSRKGIYTAVKLWVLDTYNHGNNLAQLNDDENTSMALKPMIFTYWDLGGFNSGYVHYVLNIECKDGRYRYAFTGFTYEKPCELPYLCDGDGLESEKYNCTNLFVTNSFIANHKKDFWASIKKQTDSQILGLIDAMKQSITNTLNKRKDNW
jgi:hypothetical protein